MRASPIIVIPGRFSASASALRYQALVTARALSEGVLRAGGEPVTMHPWCPATGMTPDDAGTLEQHMRVPHQHVVHDVEVAAGSMLEHVAGHAVSASCYHHQRIDRLGAGLHPVAWAAGRGIEAMEHAQSRGWFLGVQWHPEDTAAADPAQHALFAALVAAARISGARA